MDQRFWFDLFSAAVLLATALIGAWLPRYLSSQAEGTDLRSSQASLAFHLGNMLSGGVMLSAGFCHLLADSLRDIAFIGRFPITTFLAATGYIITLCADQVVQHITEMGSSTAAPAGYHQPSEQQGRGRSAAQHPGGSPEPPDSDCDDSGGANGVASGGVLLKQGYITSDSISPRASAAAARMAAFSIEVPGGEHGGGTGASSRGGSRAPSPSRTGGPACNGHAGDGGHHHPHAHHSSGSAGGAAGGPHVRLDIARTASTSAAGGCGHDHAAQLQALIGASRHLSFGTAVLLALALCIHSILEGVALGAQDTMRATEDIMVAIAAHKGLAAYALGASIVESKASATKFWIVVGLFASATPVGIGIGYAFSARGPSKLAAAMSALASGTFLYVAMMEVIPKELADPRHRLPKMAALLLGFGLMSLLAVWA